MSDDVAAREIILTQRSSNDNAGHLLRLLIKEAKDHAEAELIDLLAEEEIINAYNFDQIPL